jgi:aromatic-L-amino-acid decarboxylase
MKRSQNEAVRDMSAKDFRKFGHQLIDWVADFLDGIDEVPVSTSIRPGEIRRQLPASPPLTGEPMEEILADIDRIIMPGMTHWNHPNFFAYFNSSASAPGILGEVLSAAFNINGMVWKSCPAATELEQVSLDWLRQMLGLPDDFWGIIYDTGSTSTFHALAAAREQLADLQIREKGLSGRSEAPRLRLYTSELAHSSVDKAALALGVGQEGIRHIAVDEDYRMKPAALAAAIAEDRRSASWRPFCVVATVGTTSCTSIDPVPEIADICARENLWLHVDACYGGSAAVAPEFRHILAGCECADSFVVNPHKWLFVPIDLSAFYTRKPEALRRAFSLVPEYLRTTEEGVVNFMDYGIPLGRRFRALKLWFVLRYFGQEGLAARIREQVRLAQTFAQWVDAHPHFERLAPTPLSAVCFRAHPPAIEDLEKLNQLNENLLTEINATHEVFMSHTKLREQFTLRLVASHLRTEERHVRRAWEIIQQKLTEITGGQKSAQRNFAG